MYVCVHFFWSVWFKLVIWRCKKSWLTAAELSLLSLLPVVFCCTAIFCLLLESCEAKVPLLHWMVIKCAASSSSSSSTLILFIYLHHVQWGTSRKDKLWYPSALPEDFIGRDFEERQKKCVGGLEEGHPEKIKRNQQHSENVTPTAVGINPVKHSHISECVRQIQSAGPAALIIYQEASRLRLSSSVSVLFKIKDKI